VILDVTEQRALETQLRQAQKIEAVGQLAGGVAHDFNNLLTAILGYTALVLDDLPADSPVCDDVREIQKAGERAAALTAQLLAFSRRTLLEPRVIDLNALIRNTQSLLKRLLGEDVMLTSNLAPDLSAVSADDGQIDQMIVNLAVNARDAMPSGGHLSIDTANVMLDHAFVAEHPGATVGPHVMIAVTDTGIGMDDVVKARLFEPFYTTKGPGKGTGLGLAMVFGIVKQSGGSIWVDSQLGVGSTFTVYLPATDEPLSHEESPRPATPSLGTETILVVEDQDEVRRLVREVLGRSGYTVIVASDPHEALSLLANPASPISLLLTDVVMPNMSGRELARICHAQYPAIRVLYMSGYTDDAVGAEGLLEPGLALIQKPFAGPVLLQRVRAVLDSVDPPGV
jgi:nitrogen-specific signal transduction histidine kinase/CheY-like chemotaxis protein